MATPPAPPGAPVPNIAQLPLPPGMTLPQFFGLQKALISISISVAIGFALVLYDYLVLLRDELSLYSEWRKKGRQSPAFYAFVLLRYAGLLAVFPSLFFTSLPSDYCQFAASASQAGGVLVTASAGVIFCYRVFAIWQGNRIVTAIISFFYVAMVGSWIAVATQLRAVTGPPSPFGSNCQLLPIPFWSPIGFSSSVAFDTLTLILGLVKLRGQMHSTSRVSRQIYQDNILYFIAVTATNMVVLIIQSLPASYDLIKPNALPFSTVVTYAMGCRVFLNLKLLNQRNAREQEGLPATMNSTTSGSHQINPFPPTPYTPKSPYSAGTTVTGYSAPYPPNMPVVTKSEWIFDDHNVPMKSLR